MSVIHVEIGLLEYPDKGRLPYRQEGFTLSVKDTTLQFDGVVVKNLKALEGSYGISKIELQRPFLFVWWNCDDLDADLDEAVAVMMGACSDYLEPVF
jgi:hypothetical protein